jgi:Asp-tRNA(Asn)/Glu-tRNA(Gln) amidotransferase A subunit family amidase
LGEYIDAEIKVDKLKGAFAGYFQQYDALLCPVIPFTAPPPGLEEYVVNGRLRGEVGTARSATDLCSALSRIERRVGADPIPFGARFGANDRTLAWLQTAD